MKAALAVLLICACAGPAAAGAAIGRLEIILPATGDYKFSFSPCVMWHQYGEVAICTGAVML